jgi:hypothetical protein
MTPRLIRRVSVNLLSSGLYRRPRSFTGSCTGQLTLIGQRSCALLVGFTTGRDLRHKQQPIQFARSPCPEGFILFAVIII